MSEERASYTADQYELMDAERMDALERIDVLEGDLEDTKVERDEYESRVVKLIEQLSQADTHSEELIACARSIKFLYAYHA